MTLLFHRCPWGWWRSRGRTGQAWNHNRNEVLCVADNPNSVLNEMWFLTIDPFVGIPVSSQSFPSDNTAGVFSRTFIVKNISNSVTYTIASSCVCTSPLADMTIEGLHDFVKVSISASLKSFFCWACALTPRSPQQTLFPQVSKMMQGGTYFPETRRMLLFHAPLNLNTFLASFHAASRAPNSCHSVSSREQSSNLGALGLRSWGSPVQM